MVTIRNLNREHLVTQSNNKKIEDIALSDLKLSMSEIAMAEIIEFTCNLENKIKLLKHRWRTELQEPRVGEVRALEL
jgi:hypothetical protein